MKKLKFLLFSLIMIAGVLSCSKDSTENQALVYGPGGQTLYIETANNGGNVTCDEVAAGIIEAGVSQNIIVRLAGTNEAEGKALLSAQGYQMLDTMEDAVTAAVEAAS